MEYRRLGRSGLKVSEICLGTWLTFGGRLDDRGASALVRRAFELGINFFDTADVYELGKAEEQLGRALEGIPRKDYVLASKVYFPTGPGPNDRGLSRKHIGETVHASLRRLRTTYIDLFQCHRYDEETPLEETVRAFDELIRQDKILYWGVSFWTAEQIEEAMRVAAELGAHAPVSEQPPYSLMNRAIEAEVMPACAKCGLGILPFSPLAQGVLTGKYADGGRPDGSRAADEKRNVFMGKYFEGDAPARVARFVRLADETGISPARLAIAWILRRTEISSVIVGATKIRQLEENADVAHPPADLLSTLDEIFPTA
ncbi:MAG: aldo/keto reductase family protein [Planctomycetota bacterium]